MTKRPDETEAKIHGLSDHQFGEALTHPQTLARGMVVGVEHPQAGPTKALGCQ